MGREAYPVKLISSEEKVAVPNFKYVTQAIIVQNSIQIDRRISQMRICTCSDKYLGPHLFALVMWELNLIFFFAVAHPIRVNAARFLVRIGTTLMVD